MLRKIKSTYSESPYGTLRDKQKEKKSGGK